MLTVRAEDHYFIFKILITKLTLKKIVLDPEHSDKKFNEIISNLDFNFDCKIFISYS